MSLFLCWYEELLWEGNGLKLGNSICSPSCTLFEEKGAFDLDIAAMPREKFKRQNKQNKSGNDVAKIDEIPKTNLQIPA